MNPYTVFKFNFTFDVWINVLSDDGTTSAPAFYKEANGLLTPGASQTYMYTKEQLPYGAILRRVKDPAGQAVFEEFDTDIDRYVTASEPVFDYHGNLNGYRQTLRRNPPVVFQGQATD